MVPFEAAPDTPLKSERNDELFLLSHGDAEIVCDGVTVDKIGPGGFYGAEHILFRKEAHLHARAITAVRGFRVPGSVIEGIPIVHWKLLEIYEKRMRIAHLPA